MFTEMIEMTTSETKIPVPKGVTVHVSDRSIKVEGPKGKLERNFDDPRFNDYIDIEKSGEDVVIKYSTENRKVLAMQGTIQAHVENMILGVTAGYKYIMKIVYTHFPITVTVEKDRVQVKNFLGAKGVRSARIMGDSKLHIDKEHITITGASVEDVSQTAANIEKACKITKRDRRIFQDGIYMNERMLQTGEVI